MPRYRFGLPKIDDPTIRTWGRLRTSQWHIVHSVRSRVLKFGRQEGNVEEYILTVDGFELPTEKLRYYDDRESEPTGAKLWIGDGFPKGKICRNCSSFVYSLQNTVEVESHVSGHEATN